MKYLFAVDPKQALSLEDRGDLALVITETEVPPAAGLNDLKNLIYTNIPAIASNTSGNNFVMDGANTLSGAMQVTQTTNLVITNLYQTVPFYLTLTFSASAYNFTLTASDGGTVFSPDSLAALNALTNSSIAILTLVRINNDLLVRVNLITL